MPTPSNLYAEKIYSEHPLALWALDEEVPQRTNFYFGQVPIPPETQLGSVIPLIPTENDLISNIKNVEPFFSTTVNTYGSSTNNGHYISYPVWTQEQNQTTYILAVKSAVESGGAPLVYGASNITRIYPHNISGQPSLIIPGLGFLNESGKYNSYTLEFWIRAVSNTSVPKRFFGPVGSDDGLYILEQSIILKIGNYFTSYFVGEMSRPIFLQIQVSENGAKIISNGEVVGQINFSMSNIDLPNKIDEGGKEQDWLGFYAYAEDGTATSIQSIELDCIAIYPTLVPITVSKKRFAYGQAVEFPQNILSKYGSSTFSADFSVAEYVKNYSYPKVQRFNSGYWSNLNVSSNTISAPQYSLPNFYFTKNGRLVDETVAIKDTVENTSFAVQSFNEVRSINHIYMKPNEEYSNGYIKFENLPHQKKEFAVIYASYSLNEKARISVGKQIVFKAVDKITGNNLVVYTSRTSPSSSRAFIVCDMIVDGNTTNITSSTINLDTQGKQTFAIDVYKNQNTVNTFLTNSQNTILFYVGGDETGEQTFEGELYSFGFVDSEILSSINYSELTNNDGTLFTDTSFYPSYAIVLNQIGSLRYFDIQAAGFWTDFIPNSSLSKTNSDGDYIYDFLQINYNSDAVEIDVFDGNLYTSSTIKTTINMVEDPATISSNQWFSDYNTISEIPSTRVVQSQLSRVTSNCIVYPENSFKWNVDQEMFRKSALAIAFRIFFNGIKTNPVFINNLQISSQIENGTKVKSRYGAELEPYSAAEEINPYLIYKGSSPHNYLTDKTGIRLLGDLPGTMTRGLAFKPNKNGVPDFYISSLQFSYNYTNSAFSDLGQILEVVNQRDGYKHLKFYLEASGSNVHLKCLNVDTNQEITDLQYYVDGHLTTSPIIELKEWSTIGILFPKPLLFTQQDSINIVGPGLFNNLSYFRIDAERIATKTVYAVWNSIKGTSPFNTWNKYKVPSGDISGKWESVAYDQLDNVYSIDPQQVYNMYFGTNKIVVDSEETELLFDNYSYSIYKNTSWNSTIINPV